MFPIFKKFTLMQETNSVTSTNIEPVDGWIDVNIKLPETLETVFISNGKGWSSIGCLVYDEGWHWALTNGIFYEENGKIVSECESDDLDVRFWHKFPIPLQKK